MTAFAARRSLRGTLPFVIMAFATACFGVLLLGSGELLGAWVLGFSVVLGAFLSVQAARPGWSYAIGPHGITVNRTMGSVVLKAEDIASVETVEASRVEELVAGSPAAQGQAGRTVGIGGGIRARRELSRIVELCTAPVVFTRTRVSGPLNERSLGTRAYGRFVLVSRRDGSVRALSPRDVDGFVAAWAASAPHGA